MAAVKALDPGPRQRPQTCAAQLSADEPHRSIEALAMRLGRDYRRLHADAELLQRIGLICEDDGLVLRDAHIHAEIDLTT